MDWFWQGLATNFVWWVFIAGGGIVVGILKARAVRFIPSVMYGLAASTLIALILLALNVQHKLAIEQRAITTTGNIQERVRDCLETFRLTFHSDPKDSFYFKYVVTMKNKNTIDIIRSRDMGNYLVLKSALEPTGEAAELLTKIPEIRRNELIERLIADAAISNVSFQLSANLKRMDIEKRIPITTGLNEYVLIEAIDHVDGTLVLLRNTLAIELLRFKNK